MECWQHDNTCNLNIRMTTNTLMNRRIISERSLSRGNLRTQAHCISLSTPKQVVQVSHEQNRCMVSKKTAMQGVTWERAGRPFKRHRCDALGCCPHSMFSLLYNPGPIPCRRGIKTTKMSSSLVQDESCILAAIRAQTYFVKVT